ncbi:hypothetical protein ACLMJK_003719 [Lecanora helva]
MTPYMLTVTFWQSVSIHAKKCCWKAIFLILTCSIIPSSPAPINYTHLHKRARVNCDDLRILPLGDSLTLGEGSSDGNGYRLFLHNLIRRGGNDITYIGSVKTGSMPNNENEGHSGFQTLAVGEMGKPHYVEQPNVVLLMAGTSDLVLGNDFPNAPKRMSKVIEDIFSECPGVVVLVGTLLPLLDPKFTSAIIGFNSVMMGIVWDFTNRGKKVDLVDMGKVTTKSIRTDDGIHPTDAGYELIAEAWYDGLVKAGDNGWIQKPSPQKRPYSQESKPLFATPNSGAIEWTTAERFGSLAQLIIQVLLLVGFALITRQTLKICLRLYRTR